MRTCTILGDTFEVVQLWEAADQQSTRALTQILQATTSMADAEAEAPHPAPGLEGMEEEEDEVFLDTTMFDEDDEWLEGALAAPEDEDDDPYYFVQARTTGKAQVRIGFNSLCIYHTPVGTLYTLIHCISHFVGL